VIASANAPSTSSLISFVSTAQPALATTFYRDLLGLALSEESEFALVFDAHGTMLRITIVEHVDAAPHTVLGWAVANISQVVDALSARGLTVLRFDGMRQDERGIWQSPSGARIAWFTDPDGNVLSLTQL
jgi:predicted enzyme related to lactoylglutathione lyase